MPISLPPLSRRHFLQRTLGTGAALLAGRHLPGELFGAEAPQDPHRFALLSDTHIAANPEEVARGTNMAANLRQVGVELLEQRERPAAVLVCGDCAFGDGKSADYATLVNLLKPVREQALPVHLALGNHDHRERFWKALPPAAREQAPADRHITMIPGARANWFVLDSLMETNKTPGNLGEEQRAWLAGALDRHSDRPALVMVHHNPDDKPNTSGLTDTESLFEILAPRKHVKALFFGHTHNWHLSERAGIHCVNLPPVAYVFAEGKPNGWVDARLAENGMTLELRCLTPTHPQHASRHELQWRV
jgi:hypothetical protein